MRWRTRPLYSEAIAPLPRLIFPLYETQSCERLYFLKAMPALLEAYAPELKTLSLSILKL